MLQNFALPIVKKHYIALICHFAMLWLVVKQLQGQGPHVPEEDDNRKIRQFKSHKRSGFCMEKNLFIIKVGVEPKITTSSEYIYF